MAGQWPDRYDCLVTGTGRFRIDELELNRFFVEAQDKPLLVIVEAGPLPEASWLDHVHADQHDDWT